LTPFVRLDDNFPESPRMASVDDEPAFENVGAMTAGVFKHATQVYFVELPVFHTLQEMGTQLEFPFPPRWPLACRQRSSSSPSPSPIQVGHINEEGVIRPAGMQSRGRLPVRADKPC
jgi:hypothetical protein